MLKAVQESDKAQNEKTLLDGRVGDYEIQVKRQSVIEEELRMKIDDLGQRLRSAEQ